MALEELIGQQFLTVAALSTIRAALQPETHHRAGRLPSGPPGAEAVISAYLFVQSDGISPGQLGYTLEGPPVRGMVRHAAVLGGLRDATAKVLRSRRLAGRVQVAQASDVGFAGRNSQFWVARDEHGRIRLCETTFRTSSQVGAFSRYIDARAHLRTLPADTAHAIARSAVDWAVSLYTHWPGSADPFLAENAWRTELGDDRAPAFAAILSAFLNPSVDPNRIDGGG